jgi:hypothetical protein
MKRRKVNEYFSCYLLRAVRNDIRCLLVLLLLINSTGFTNSNQVLDDSSKQTRQIERPPKNVRTRVLSGSCFVCGSNALTILNRNKILLFQSSFTSCGKLEQQGLDGGLIYATQCTSAQQAVTEKCECISKNILPTPAPAPGNSEFSSLLGSLRHQVDAPVPPPTTQSKTESTNEPTSSTYPPTISNIPTRTLSPTYHDKCYVCGSSDSSVSVSDEQTVTVQDSEYTCSEMEQLGLAGYIATGQECDEYIQAIRENDICKCKTSIEKFLDLKLMSTISGALWKNP